MLVLEGLEELGFATAYRDDTSDTRFYILPNVPILRREDGKAVMKYVKYRSAKPLKGGGLGAALVFMDIELALTPEQEQQLRAKLVTSVKARRGQNDPRPLGPEQIELAKPPITDATVAVEILAASEDLVQRVNTAGKPSMYGNNVVAMSAELTQLGAPVFEAVMKGEGAGGVRVVYDMTFPAKLPPITGVGHWTASKFYSFVQDVDYEENFWSEDDMTENISEMFANSESRFVDVQPGSLPNSDPSTATILEAVRNGIERSLDEAVKRNLLEAIPPESRDVSKIRDEDFENIKRSVTVNKSADVTINYREGQVAAVRKLPQANMRSLTSQGFNWDDYAIEADTDDPFFAQLNLVVQVNADFVRLPLFSVDVSIDYPPATAKHGIKTFTFKKSDDVGKFDAFLDGGGGKFKYQYTVHYKGEARKFESQWIDHEGDDLKIDIDDLGLWIVDVEAADINFDQVERVAVTFEHPPVGPDGPQPVRFTIDKDHPTATVSELLLQPAQPYKVSLRYFMADGREYVREQPGQKGQRYYVDDPFAGNKTVQLRTRGDFEHRIDTIFADLKYEDAVNAYTQTYSVALGKDKRFDDWTFPVVDEHAGKVTYRTVTTFTDGTVAEAGDKDFDGQTLLLGEDVATLVVRMVPDLVDWAAIKLAKVDLHYSDAPNSIDEHESFTFRSGDPEKTWELALRNKQANTYQWHATYFEMPGTGKKEADSNGPVADELLVLEVPA
jgi:hypothetical protein